MTAHTATPVPFEVRVVDARGKPIRDAKVKIVDSQGKSLDFTRDPSSGALAGTAPRGKVTIEVAMDGMDTQTRVVNTAGAPPSQLFILAEKGTTTYFREQVRVPFTADDDLVAVTLAKDAKGRNGGIGELDSATASLDIEEVEIPKLAYASGMRLYRAKSPGEAIEHLRRLQVVVHVGAVVAHTDEYFSHLTDQAVVQFRGPRGEEVDEIAKEYGFGVERELVAAPNTYVLGWLGGGGTQILQGIERLVEREDVVWAEPSVVTSPMLDAITPADTLWNGLWDRQLIGLPDAWQELQDAGLSTFGDPDITLAVWDSGTQTSVGVPTNPDFQGTLSDGTPKVKAAYDFENMVANNDSPWSDHGSGVAGVSVAKANNPSPVNAQGVVGSAPNVGILLVEGRVPYIDLEVSDQYLWMAGFNPSSPIAGFPAPLAIGADVITCSLTPGAGAPLSGTARATLDFVTTFGRGGKGTLCFFSTGNQSMNLTTWRPYGAHEKTFSIAATSYANDGVTEVLGTYSGWGPDLDLCAPSQDVLGTTHNPPTGYMPWSASHANQGNLPTSITQTTSLTAASTAGALSITVASVAGFAAGSVIHIGPIGANGSDPAVVSSVNAATNQLTLTGGVPNAHAAGSTVVTGPAHHKNNFGGTSSATPLAAGVGALVLSANPSVTFIEAREILRSTAVKLDTSNTDPVGQWLDINGTPSVTSGLPPIRSGWYGFGRIDAAAAVNLALSFPSNRDIVIRDNLADTGVVSSSGAFWNSPDIWCRTSDPAGDPVALPASYAVAGPHEAPVRGQTNWLMARVRNNGTADSLDAWVRASVTHWPGTEFTYPDSFIPSNGPGDPLPSPLAPGTYFIGEVKVTGLGPGAEEVVAIEWPAALIPPDTVATPGGNVTWHPCLLVEVTPHDGPAPTGNHVWDDNNLAQKNITIVNADAGSDFATAFVLGNFRNLSTGHWLEVHRGNLPQEVQLYVDLLDPVLLKRLDECEPGASREQPDLSGLLENAIAGAFLERFGAPLAGGRPGSSVIETVRPIPEVTGLQPRPARRDWKVGMLRRREVVFLRPRYRVRVPICGDRGRPQALVVGGIVGGGATPGAYEVVLMQREPDGSVGGSAAIEVRIGKG